MPNYIDLIGDFYPGTEAYISGDPTVYDNIVWVSAAIPQATLDATVSMEIIGDIELPNTIFQHVYNDTGVLIPAGTPVYATGHHPDIERIYVAPSDASNAATMPAIGVTPADIPIDTSGCIVSNGNVGSLNTSSWSINDNVYVASGGGLTTTKPTGTNLIHNIGTVIKTHATDGDIIVHNPGQSNDIPNIANGKVWMGNGSDVPTATDVYTEAEVDALLSGDITITSGAQLILPIDGTLSEPAISNGSNTGINLGNTKIEFITGGTKKFVIGSNGTLVAWSTDYETLVTNDDDIPNKKYVDDAVSAGGGADGASYGELTYATLTEPGAFHALVARDLFTNVTVFDTAESSGGTTVVANHSTNDCVVGSTGAGAYLITASVSGRLDAGTDTLVAAVYKNGVTTEIGARLTASDTHDTNLALTGIIDLVEGDAIILRLTNDDNGATGFYHKQTHLTMVRVSGGATGATGVAGADGDIVWNGDWVSQNYTANQAVQYNGSSYVCRTNTTSSQVPTDTNYWDLVAAKGDTGAQGPASDGTDFTEAWTNIGRPSSINTWQTKTVTGAPANSVISIMIVQGSQIKEVGVRAVGSSLDRRTPAAKDTTVTFLVKTNGSSQIQWYSESTSSDITFYYAGAFV